MAYKLQQIYDVTIVVLSVAFEKNINDCSAPRSRTLGT